MKEKILIINAGSSSLKLALYEMPEGIEQFNAYVEKIGQKDSFYTFKCNGESKKQEKPITNHTEAVVVMIEELLNNHIITDINEISGIGHRVVHGGEKYNQSVVITEEVIEDIKEFTKFAPLHHPGNLAGIESMQKVIPNALQVAVFDTAFHQTMPKENYMYAVPYEWYTENGVRKYGFHGTSHKYITETMQKYYNKEEANLIICHIGSGASISCIKDGKCYNTSMGLTPLDGLIMGTRSGAIDSSIIEYISKEKNLTVEEVTTILNKKSGLLGISGKNDFRDLEQLANEGNEQAKLAIAMFKQSIINYIAQYYFQLKGQVDALVFTAGIGENAITLREDIVNDLAESMHIELNPEANNKIAKFKGNPSGIISTENSNIDIMVVPTNEEYMILKDTYGLSNQVKNQGYPRVRR